MSLKAARSNEVQRRGRNRIGNKYGQIGPPFDLGPFKRSGRKLGPFLDGAEIRGLKS